MTLDEIKAHKDVIGHILESLARQYGEDLIRDVIEAFQRRRIHKQADAAIADIHEAAERKRREAEGAGQE